MTAREFDRQGSLGVTGYLKRWGLEPSELRIKALRWGRRTKFTFHHNGVYVHSCFGRPEARAWLSESPYDNELGIAPMILAKAAR